MGWPLHWQQANGCRGQTLIGSLGAEDIDYPFSGLAGYSKSDRVGFFPQEVQVLLQRAQGVVKLVEGWASDRVLGSAQQPQEEKCCKLRPRPLCARFTYILWTLLLSKVCLHKVWNILKKVLIVKSSWYQPRRTHSQEMNSEVRRGTCLRRTKHFSSLRFKLILKQRRSGQLSFLQRPFFE